MSNETPMQGPHSPHMQPGIAGSSPMHGRRWYSALTDRVRGSTGALLTVSQTPPGALHAASGVTAHSLSYTPAHVISPAADFVQRCIALFAAVFAVCAIYAYLNPTAAAFARDYTIETVAAAASRLAGAFVTVPEAGTAVVAQIESSSQLDGTSHVGSERLAAAAILVGETDASVHEGAAMVAAATATAAATGTRQAFPSAVPSAGSIAVSVAFSGSEVAYGDIVSYDPESSTYTLSRAADGADVYGVVVQTPPLLFRPMGREGDISVVHTGPALMNVTMENGPIAVGDPVSVSSIPGKGRRAVETDYVIGLAVEPFDGEDGVMLASDRGGDVLSSTILVNVSAGAGVGEDGAGAAAATACQSFLCRFFAAVEGDSVDLVVRYSLAAAVAAVSVWFAFKSFVSEANYGVISVGRNPRAKASIQSMVVFNAVLALVVAGAGIFASILIIIAAP